MKGRFVVALCAALFFGPCCAHGDEEGTAEAVARIEHELQTVRQQVDQEFHDHPELSKKDQSLLGKASQLAAHAGAGKVVNKIVVKKVKGAEKTKTHVGVEETAAEREITSDVHKFLEQDWAAEAPEDSKSHHAVQFIQEDTASNAGARLLTGLANTESRLARNGVKVVHEVDEIKDGVVDALGESNPRLAAKVEKLMDQVRGKEKDVMRAELREAKNDRTEVPKLLFQQRSTMLRHQAEVGSQTMSAMQRLATSEAKMATKEAHLAHNEARVVNEIQEAKGAIAAALGKEAPDVAEKVERLMSYAQRKESVVAHNEVREAQRNLQRAKNAEATVHGRKHYKNHQKTMLIQQRHREGLSQQQRASHMAGIANRELRLAGEDMHILKEMNRLQGDIADALQDEDPLAARKAEHLMSLAQHEQGNIFRREFKDAKKDFRKAVSQESAIKARRAQSFAQKSSIETSGHAMFSKFAHEAHKLRNLAKRKGKTVKEGKHILEETREARSAVRRELGGTAIGHEISQLLKEAQVEEKRALAASRKGVTLTKREANAAIRLATAVRSE